MSDDQSDFPSAAVLAGSAGAGTIPGPTPAGYQPLYDLTSPQAVTVASFLAGPLAGVWLLARNYRQLGRRAAAWWTLGGGVVAIALFTLLMTQLPDRVPPIAFSVPLVLAIWQLATRTQGAAFEDHIARSGPRTSGGKIAAISIASIVILVGAVVGGVIAYEMLRRPPKIDLGGGHEVYYRDGATADDARKVGEALEQHRFFLPDHPSTATVQRPRSGIAVGLVVRDPSGSAHDEGFRAVAVALSHDVFDGAPVDVWLLDDGMEVRHRIVWDDGP